MDAKEEIIRNYIHAYNSFDVKGMVRDLAPSVKFTNLSNGKVTLATEGLKAFEEQAMQAVVLFSQRKQTILSVSHTDDNTVEIGIDYHAILAVDLPNGLNKGDELSLSGKSIFTFNAENQITALKDVS